MPSSTGCYTAGIIYTVHVKPGSSKGPLVEHQEDGVLTVFLHEKAVDGQANKALVDVLAKFFSVAKRDVVLLRGQKSRVKHVEILGVNT